jgi:hypothetical protein
MYTKSSATRTTLLYIKQEEDGHGKSRRITKQMLTHTERPPMFPTSCVLAIRDGHVNCIGMVKKTLNFHGGMPGVCTWTAR